MANIDNSFNRNRLIGLYLKESGLSNILGIENFDDHFDFDDPLRIDISPTSKNTNIYITAKITSEYFGRKTMNYNRIHITDIPTITVDKTTENTLYELLPIINQKYGLFINSEDIEDIDISSIPTGPYTPVLTIKSTSLIFYSGTKIVTV